MPITRLEYLERFLDCCSLVKNGKSGAICDDRFLASYYERGYYSILRENGLEHGSSSVRCETILLLAKLHEPEAIKDIQELSVSDVGSVSDSCITFLSAMKEMDVVKSDLFFILDHKDGVIFRNAAMRMSKVATADDIPELRRIYGQVDGAMRNHMRSCLENVVDRYPELAGKRVFLLSVPVFPDEVAFDRFLDKSIVYLDIRYRDSVEPYPDISLKAYNNIVKAIRTMQIRIFNERDNLKFYTPSKTKRLSELESLILWAANDLSTKDVVNDDPGSDAIVAPVVDLLDSANS